MTDRFQCLRCGAIQYSDPFDNTRSNYTKNDDIDAIFDALPGVVVPTVHKKDCTVLGCGGRCVPVTDNMAEIAEAFYKCGYAISKAYDRDMVLSDDKRTLLIALHFNVNYTTDVFPDLPQGYIYTSAEDGCIIEYRNPDYSELSILDRQIARDDAIAAIYTWITELSKTGYCDIWKMAALI